MGILANSEKASYMPGCSRKSVAKRSKKVFILLYVALVRLNVEYWGSLWKERQESIIGASLGEELCNC